MTWLARFLILLVFPLFLVARGLNALLGRDPLRLRPLRRDSYWVERGLPPGTPSYFSEASESEGGNQASFGRMATLSLEAVAILFAPPRDHGDGEFKSTLKSGEDIPDEIYTLW